MTAPGGGTTTQTRFLRQRYEREKFGRFKKPSGWTLGGGPTNYLASSAPVQPIEACAARRRAVGAQNNRPIRRSPCSPSLPTPLVDHRARSTTFCSFPAQSFSHSRRPCPLISLHLAVSPLTIVPGTPRLQQLSDDTRCILRRPRRFDFEISSGAPRDRGAQSFFTAAARSFANHSALDHH